jgi:nicotinamide riboside kinase
MKILLVGAQGTGKSVLAKEIQKRHPSLHLIDGIHRNAQQEGFQINKTNDIESQLTTIRRYLNQLNTNTKQDFISVSSIIRQTAYAVNNKLPDYVLRLLFALCQLEAQHFADFVFYLPIEFPLVRDGVRAEDIEYQKTIDSEIQKLLETFYSLYPNYFIIRGSVEERVKHIEDIICKEF